MYSFLGPHINRTVGSVVQMTQVWHPPVATVLDPDFGWAPIAQAMRTKFVWRFYRPWQPDWNNPATDPEQEARRWLAETLKRMLEMAGAGGYWQGDNEPTIDSPAAMARYCAFEIARMRLLAGYGLRAAVGAFAVGNPKALGWWEQFLPALKEGVKQGAILTLHEYNWPGLEGDARHDPAWLSLRHRFVYGGEPSSGWWGVPEECRLPIMVTECGNDSIFGEPNGFRKSLTTEQYLRSLEWYSQELSKDPYVLGACVYCASAESMQWAPYEIYPDVMRGIADRAVPVYRGYVPEIRDVLGGDFSRWQGAVDWKRVASAGIRFAVLRCSVGPYVDSAFARNLAGCRDASIIPMAYHFLQKGDVGAQVAAAARALAGQKDLRLWVDLEKDATSGTWPARDEFAHFCEGAAVLSARPLGCYTSRHMVGLVGFNPWGVAGLSRMPLWAADWNRAFYRKPRVPAGAPSWKIQQYSSSGTIPGVSGRVDLDVWNGSLRSLAEFAGG